MASNAKLFSVGDFDFRLQHLLIIGILAIAVSASGLIRAQPASYGFELHEFDPFFNYRATEFVLNNGYDAYFDWHDEMSWHPYGRDVSATSQVMLHLVTATFYKIFGFGATLYDFTIMFPLVIGSLTSIIIFALVRVVGGTTAGLIASLMFAVATPVLARGMIGWFKSEPLGLFFGFLAIYLFLSGIKTNKGKISFTKIIIGGIFLAIGFSSWGGIQFFLIPLAAFFIALPFFRRNDRFLIYAIPTFSITIMLSSLLFERPPTSFVLGYGGFLILLPTAFFVIVSIIQKFSTETKIIRNSLITLGAFVGAAIAVILSGNISENQLPTFRYLNAVNPLLSTEDPLTRSVAEHAVLRLSDSFTHMSIFIVFGIIGAWLLFSYKTKNPKFLLQNDMKVFVLIFGIIGIYISSAFIRMELFGAVALIILGSIGLAILLHNVFMKKTNIIKFVFCIVVIGLMITPLMLPEKTNWITKMQSPPTILHGGSYFWQEFNDWPDAMEWLKDNTPSDSVIFSWWDYGYYIETLGERTTLIDNATLINWQIEKAANTLISEPDNAWVILNSDYKTNVVEHFVSKPVWHPAPGAAGIPIPPENYHNIACDEIPVRDPMCEITTWSPEITGFDADYVLIYVAGQRYNVPGIPVSLYDLAGGGDESKKHWFMQIAGVQQSNYVYGDGHEPTPHFWKNTLLGKLIPFSVVTYADPNTNRNYESYHDGLFGLYTKDIKYIDSDDPFRLVYASPSFQSQLDGPFSAVLIYEINHEYIQKNN